MNHRLNEAEIRSEVARLETLDARLTNQLRSVDQHRRELEEQRTLNANRAETLRAELREILEEPELQRQLERAVASLHGRLERPLAYPGDGRSPTRQRVRLTLEALEGDGRTTTRDKLRRVQELARDFTERRQLDSQHFAATERR